MADIPPKLTNALADQYAVRREIGAGGMATVYLAEDLKHGRQVAIKVLRPDLVEAVRAERFRMYKSGRWPLPMNEVIRETVDFLDRYAGEVN